MVRDGKENKVCTVQLIANKISDQSPVAEFIDS